MRNDLGQFKKGYVAPIEEKLKRIEAWKNAFKKGKHYIGDKKHTYLYNSWRAFKHSKKGKKAGWDKSWDDFNNFYEDMIERYSDGLRLFRLNVSKPFSKENCKWMSQEDAHILHDRHTLFEHNGEIKTFKQWGIDLKIPHNAIKCRYVKWKGKATSSEILFGKPKQKRKDITDYKELQKQAVRSKASKMISSYRCSDKKKNIECNLTIDFVVNKIFTSNCTYCGTDKNIGCDRIDNTKGHTIENVIPACYECNVIRKDYFSMEEMKKIGKTIAEIRAQRQASHERNISCNA